MKNILAGLTSKGACVVGTAPAHRDWRSNESVMNNIRSADIVVVNGEGTIHHNRKSGSTLLEVGKYAREIGIKSALINFSWFNNSEKMLRMLADFDVISARDSFSWDQVRNFRSDSLLVPDLSMAGPRPPSRVRSGLGVGDSVDFSVTAELLKFLDGTPSRYFSIIYPGDRAFGRSRLFLSALRDVFSHRNMNKRARIEWGWRNAFQSISDEQKFLSELSGLGMLITGRFHGVALSVLAGTPFLAIRSNTPKIEALINDIGISKERLISREDLSTDRIGSLISMEYSGQEANNMRDFFRTLEGKTSQLFGVIRSLVA